MRSALKSILFCLLFAAYPVNAADDSEQLARELLVDFTEAVMSGPEAVAPLLAPEYQIMRSNGIGYDRDGYLKTGVGTVKIKPDFSHHDLHVTKANDVLVVRYMLEIDETISGEPIKKRAPRLTVFRKVGDQWKVVAHSNFAVK